MPTDKTMDHATTMKLLSLDSHLSVYICGKYAHAVLIGSNYCPTCLWDDLGFLDEHVKKVRDATGLYDVVIHTGGCVKMALPPTDGKDWPSLEDYGECSIVPLVDGVTWIGKDGNPIPTGTPKS